MLGVSEHSGFRGDPWGRLHRTSRFLATTTYGSIPDAERSIKIVRAIHRRVRGTTPDGEEYRADDPHLLGWIHAAEADSFLATYRYFGRDPLTEEMADAYVAQSGFLSAKLGVIDPPQTAAELDDLLTQIPSGADELAGRARGGRPAAPRPAVERTGQGGLRRAGRGSSLDAAGLGAYGPVPAVVAGHRPTRGSAANPDRAQHDPLGARRRGKRLRSGSPPARSGRTPWPLPRPDSSSR